MSSESTPITVLWENNCGETLFEQAIPASQVVQIIETDPCAEYNGYVLPDGREVDSVTFMMWYRNTFN